MAQAEDEGQRWRWRRDGARRWRVGAGEAATTRGCDESPVDVWELVNGSRGMWSADFNHERKTVASPCRRLYIYI